MGLGPLQDAIRSRQAEGPFPQPQSDYRVTPWAGVTAGEGRSLEPSAPGLPQPWVGSCWRSAPTLPAPTWAPLGSTHHPDRWAESGDPHRESAPCCRQVAHLRHGAPLAGSQEPRHLPRPLVVSTSPARASSSPSGCHQAATPGREASPDGCRRGPSPGLTALWASQPGLMQGTWPPGAGSRG